MVQYCSDVIHKSVIQTERKIYVIEIYSNKMKIFYVYY